MPRLTGVRALPWTILLELAVKLREHWRTLTPGERAHLSALIRKSQGRPGNLSARERDDVRRLVRKLELASLGREVLPLGRRMRGAKR